MKTAGEKGKATGRGRQAQRRGAGRTKKPAARTAKKKGKIKKLSVGPGPGGKKATASGGSGKRRQTAGKAGKSKARKGPAQASGGGGKGRRARAVRPLHASRERKSTRRANVLTKACFGSLPQGERADGFALLLATADGHAGGWKTRFVRRKVIGGGAQTYAAQARRMTTPTRCRQLARTLEAVAGPHRIAIVCKLLEGPATYRALQKATGLKAGPLYHHINRLRLALLVAPKERDLYRLTRAGRVLLLTLLAVAGMLSDTRPLT